MEAVNFKNTRIFVLIKGSRKKVVTSQNGPGRRTCGKPHPKTRSKTPNRAKRDSYKWTQSNLSHPDFFRCHMPFRYIHRCYDMFGHLG